MFEKIITRSMIVVLILQIVTVIHGIWAQIDDFGVIHDDVLVFTGLFEHLIIIVLSIPILTLSIVYIVQAMRKRLKVKAYVIVLISLSFCLAVAYFPVSSMISQASELKRSENINNRIQSSN